MGSLKEISSSEFNIEVDDILPFSAAKAIGLQVVDLITSVNDKMVKTRDLTEINRELSKLKASDKYRVLIQRGEKSLTLNGHYKSSELSVFNLLIYLDSFEKHSPTVATMIDIKRKLTLVSLIHGEGLGALWTMKEYKKAVGLLRLLVIIKGQDTKIKSIRVYTLKSDEYST
jgi:hypothetical protein